MNTKSVTKEYSNGEITVVWQSGLCIHSKNCWKGLPQVFDPENNSPWVDINAATSNEIMAQVDKCPSGALSYYKNSEGKKEAAANEATTRVEVMKNGPLLVHGDIVLKDKHGNESTKSKVTAFCRCGQSANKPMCDGTHNVCGFKDE